VTLKNRIRTIIQNASISIRKPLVFGKDFNIVHLKAPHVPPSLPPGKIAVYSFRYKKTFLKIGQAGKNSSARYSSNHYFIYKNSSTLAKSLFNDQRMKKLIGATPIDQWIKNNCDRYDVIINSTLDDKKDKMILNFIEGLMHYCFKPKYEN
jgi:hypothetical protein